MYVYLLCRDNTVSQTLNTWYGYKFVGDNVDKNIKPSYQHHEIRGQSLHHFQGYAVRDRLDLSHLSNQRPSFSMPDPSIIVPSSSDVTNLRSELEILISRLVLLINNALTIHIYHLYLGLSVSIWMSLNSNKISEPLYGIILLCTF